MLYLVTTLCQNFIEKIPFVDHLSKLSNAMYKKLNTVFYLKHDMTLL